MTELTDWLRLREGGAAYAVHAASVLADYATERLQQSPSPRGALGWLLGIGGDLPVFGLPGSPRRRSGKGRVVVLAATRPVGFAVDAIEGFEEHVPSTFRRLPPRILGRLFTGAAVDGEEVILVVEPEGVAAEVAASDFRILPIYSVSVTVPFPVPPAAPPDPVSIPDRLLVFAGSSGTVQFGLAAEQVLEIIQPTQVRTVPGAPDATLGLIAWRDEPVPILDLELAVGARSGPPPGGRLLLARGLATGGVVAIPVQGVTEILQRPLKGEVRALPLTQGASWVRQVYEDPGRRIALPNLDLALATTNSAAAS
jgi:chemotaxis signal transduction protein